jgi:uncharacterized protein YeaO (DUF488 family)
VWLQLFKNTGFRHKKYTLHLIYFSAFGAFQYLKETGDVSSGGTVYPSLRERIKSESKKRTVTILFSAKDTEHNNATVLRELLSK